MRILLVLFTALLIQFSVNAQSKDEFIPADKLLKDYEIMRSSLLTLHPGLYRFQDSLTVEKHFATLKKKLSNGMTLKEAYLAFSYCTAALKCGHTFCSYYNQAKNIRTALFDGDDKLPFTFILSGKRMFITNPVYSAGPAAGSEVSAINNIAISSILDTLVKITKGDGNNDGKRLHSLQLTGLTKYEPFDIYFPLLFPPVNGKYTVTVKEHNKKKKFTLSAVSRSVRLTEMENKYGKFPTTDNDLWKFSIRDDSVGYLQIGTFVLQRLTINYKEFLSTAFDSLKQKNITRLIVDIRGNEGGMDEVVAELLVYFAGKPVSLSPFRRLVVYNRVPDSLAQYLQTWDTTFYDRTGTIIPDSGRFYKFKADKENNTADKSPSAFAGKIILLCDRANSSATFFLTKLFKDNKLGTVMGSTTGGNRMGTNGGQLFFLKLPNSGIEIDIPLIGYYPRTKEPDEGIRPDIEIENDVNALLHNRDTVIEKAAELLRR